MFHRLSYKQKGKPQSVCLTNVNSQIKKKRQHYDKLTKFGSKVQFIWGGGAGS